MTKALPFNRWAVMTYKPNQWSVDHVHSRGERFVAITTCRQCGKTETAAMEIDEGMSRSADEFGPPIVGILANDYARAKLSVDRYMERLARTFGPKAYVSNTNEHVLKIIDPMAGTLGATLRWMTADSVTSVLGYTFSKLIIDEAQGVSDEVMAKVRPTVSVRGGDIRAFGTPDISAEQSWFKGMWLMGQDDAESDYYSYTLSCYENKWMSAEDIRLAKATLPAREFAMLYEGRWVDDEGGVFTNIDSALIHALPVINKKNYVMGVDFAIHEDFTVVIVGDPATRTALHIERWNKTDPIDTYERIVDIWEEWGHPTAYVDSTGLGEPMARELQDRGIRTNGIKITAGTKLPMVQRLAGDIEHRRIMFPAEWEQMVRELRGYMFHRTKGGTLTANAAAGFHDDCVMALVMLNEGFHRKGRGGFGQQYNYLGGNGIVDRIMARVR